MVSILDAHRAVSNLLFITWSLRAAKPRFSGAVSSGILVYTENGSKLMNFVSRVPVIQMTEL